VLHEEVRVQVGQLDGIADGLDLTGQATDVGVVDVRHLFEDQVLDLGLGDPFVDEARTGVQQQGVADPDRLSVETLGHPADALLVGVRHHEHPVVTEELLEHDDLADPLEATGCHDVEGFVEHDLAPRRQVAGIDRGRDGDPHLATAGEDVDRGVVVGLEDQAVGRWRLGQAVDLALEGDDLLAGLLECPDEAFVLGRQCRQRGLQLHHTVLEVGRMSGRVLETAAKCRDLFGKQGLLPLGLRSIDWVDRGRLLLLMLRRVVGHLGTSSQAPVGLVRDRWFDPSPRPLP
jgi:hypothetical protein